jgi:hypothetical protein
MRRGDLLSKRSNCIVIMAAVALGLSYTTSHAARLSRFDYDQFYVLHWILGPSASELNPPLQIEASLGFWPTLPRPIFNPWAGETRLTPPREVGMSQTVWPTMFSPWDGRWDLKNVAYSLGENPKEEYFGKSPDFEGAR